MNVNLSGNEALLVVRVDEPGVVLQGGDELVPAFADVVGYQLEGVVVVALDGHCDGLVVKFLHHSAGFVGAPVIGVFVLGHLPEGMEGLFPGRLDHALDLKPLAVFGHLGDLLEVLLGDVPGFYGLSGLLGPGVIVGLVEDLPELLGGIGVLVAGHQGIGEPGLVVQ